MRPTAKQLKYLRVLADRTGTSFAMPNNVNEASLEISRLKKALETAPAEKRAWETLSAKRDRKHIARYAGGRTRPVGTKEEVGRVERGLAREEHWCEKSR